VSDTTKPCSFCFETNYPSRKSASRAVFCVKVQKRILLRLRTPFDFLNMGSVCQCLFHFCCGDADEEGTHQSHQQHRPIEVDLSLPAHMTRTLTDSNSQEDVSRVLEDTNSRGNDDVSCSAANTVQPHEVSLHQFFRSLSDRFRVRSYDAIRSRSDTDEGRDGVFRERRPPVIRKSPLRMASSFSSSKGTPTIRLDEIVLPGSALQIAMAKEMAQNLDSHEDECVICMEGFDATNPRMPTLCGCGPNNTYFHLPCLYQWIEQSHECPSCRQKLSWEEF
jgi:hypothetical protein